MVNDQQTNSSNQNKQKIILISIIGVLLVIISLKFYLDYQNQAELRSENETVKQQRDEVKKKLTSIKNDLELKIEEIKKLGGDVKELEDAYTEINGELEKVKSLRNYYASQYKQIQEKVVAYEELLFAKDKEIERLKDVNTQLLDETVTLKQEKENLNDSISDLANEKEKLSEKVAIAARLKAENVRVTALNTRGKEKSSPFKNRQVDQLKVAFNLAKNDVAEIGGRDIMIRVIEPGGSVVFDVAHGSGTFMYNGREEFYTSKKNILFDNTKQNIIFNYKKNTDYKEGKHQIEIYAENYLIGKSTFEVK